MKLKQLLRTILPLLLMAVLLTGNAQAALLDFGPIVPEVVGSTPPNLQTGFPAWFRDTNRVPLQLCLEEVPGCLFAAVDRPNLAQPLAFPNIPDELFYYSATATIPNAIDGHLLFAGVEMNFFDNGDGTYEQVGFSRVRIRIDTTIAGRYTVTTPWKQYSFNATQADIDATGDGRRVINATEDIGLGPDGVFAGVLEGNVGPYVYNVGAPFGTAPNLYLGTGAPLPIVGPGVFRIEGPSGFATVSTSDFAITGKLYPGAIATPLTVDKATYALDNTGMQVNAFATTQALSNQVNPAAAFPLNFALTGAPSVLQLTAAGVPTQDMATNNPGDGKFFSASGLFAAPGLIPANITATNTADVPPTVKTVPLVDEVVIDNAAYNKLTGTLSITASSFDKVANPVLQAFLPGMTAPLGTLSNGLINVTFPVIDNSGPQPKTYTIPTSTITVKSAKGGSATASVVTFVPVLTAPAPATGVSIASNLASPEAAQGTQITFIASGTGGSGSYEYSYWLFDGTSWSEILPYSTNDSWTWNTTGLATGVTYTIAVKVRSVGSNSPGDAAAYRPVKLNPTTISVLLTANTPSPQLPGTSVTFNAGASGSSGNYAYEFYLFNGTAWTLVQGFSSNPTWTWNSTGLPAGNYQVGVNVMNSSLVGTMASSYLGYTLTTPVASVNVVSDQPSPHAAGTPVVFAASGVGGSGNYEFEFSFFNGTTWSLVQPYSGTSFWTLPGATPGGSYTIGVNVRNAGAANASDAVSFVPYVVQ